jgi:hypothetical protein
MSALSRTANGHSQSVGIPLSAGIRGQGHLLPAGGTHCYLTCLACRLIFKTFADNWFPPLSPFCFELVFRRGSHLCAIVWFQQEQRSLKAGDVCQQESRTTAAASMKLTTDNFSAEKVGCHHPFHFSCAQDLFGKLFRTCRPLQVAMATQQQKQTVTSSGRFNQERHAAAASQSKLTINAKSVRKELSVVSSSQVSGRSRRRNRSAPPFAFRWN